MFDQRRENRMPFAKYRVENSATDTVYHKKYAHGFCFAVLCCGYTLTDFPYPSGLLHWHCGNLTIAPVPAKQPWWIWINTSCEFIMNDCITTTKQSTTKPCAYFLGYTVCAVWKQYMPRCEITIKWNYLDKTKYPRINCILPRCVLTPELKRWLPFHTYMFSKPSAMCVCGKPKTRQWCKSDLTFH